MSTGTMTHTRKGWGRIMLSRNGPIRVQKVFLMTKSLRFLKYIFICFISGDSASHFLGLIMLIKLLGTLAQTNVRVDS